jgi:hypothetical protein
MLLTIAFLCFAVQVVAWIILPTSAPEAVAEPVAAEHEMMPAQAA